MRVAHIGVKGFPARGGAEKVVEAIARRMPAYGIQPTIYCCRRETPPGLRIPGVELVRIPSVPGKHIRMVTLDSLAAIHAVACGRYDLVHIHHVETSFILPLLRTRYRVIGTSHGAPYWRHKWGPVSKRILRAMEQPFMLLCDARTSVSAQDAARLSKQFRREVTHIPNGAEPGCSPDVDAANKLLDSHGLVPGGYALFVAARMDPTKGAHLAVEAVSNLPGGLPLLVVGNLQPSGYGRALLKMAGPTVHFHPLVEEAGALYGLMAGATFLVFPSLTEGMSMVLLEAASLGVPVISSDIAENRQVLGDHAIYCSSGDAGSLRDRLIWAVEHAAELAQIGSRAAGRVRTDNCWDAIASQYVRSYHELLNR